MDPSEFSKEDGEQLEVLHQVFEKYCERNAKYHDTWKQYGALSQLVRSANKVDRLMEVWWHSQEGIGWTSATHQELDEMLDDAIDAINHLVFFVRAARAGNITGSTPSRPHTHEFMVFSDGVYGSFARCACGESPYPVTNQEMADQMVGVDKTIGQEDPRMDGPSISDLASGRFAARQVEQMRAMSNQELAKRIDGK